MLRQGRLSSYALASRSCQLGLGISLSLLAVSSSVAAQSTISHGLTVSRWDNGTFNAVAFTNAQADTAFTAATNILYTDSDGAGSGDSFCNVQLYRTGSVRTFNVSDGTISNFTEMYDVATATANYVKVVKALTYCGAAGAFLGCAIQGYANHIVVGEAASKGSLAGKVWAHEFGHSVSLGHNSASKNLMNTTVSSATVYVTPAQCSYFKYNYVDHDGPFGNPAGRMRSALHAEEPQAAKSYEGVPIEQVARSYFPNTVPAEVEDFYGADDIEVLKEMLADADQADYHTTILQLMGLISDGRNSDLDTLIDYVEAGSDDHQALASATISIGYLANKGNANALAYLKECRKDTNSPLADWAVTGLVVSGRPEALAVLRGMHAAASRPGARIARFSQAKSHIEHAIRESTRMADIGLRAYYGR